jgi:hypothetical protein
MKEMRRHGTDTDLVPMASWPESAIIRPSRPSRSFLKQNDSNMKLPHESTTTVTTGLMPGHGVCTAAVWAFPSLSGRDVPSDHAVSPLPFHLAPHDPASAVIWCRPGVAAPLWPAAATTSSGPLQPPWPGQIQTTNYLSIHRGPQPKAAIL